jgi:hypothetical protein
MLKRLLIADSGLAAAVDRNPQSALRDHLSLADRSSAKKKRRGHRSAAIAFFDPARVCLARRHWNSASYRAAAGNPAKVG